MALRSGSFVSIVFGATLSRPRRGVLNRNNFLRRDAEEVIGGGHQVVGLISGRG